MKELGEFLKDTRRSHGVKLEEAAEDLGMTCQELENIESANMRAFKDIYDLKRLVASYAKYLGLDPLKVQEEFNDFLFEHTSKISLDDILEAKRKREEMERKEKKVSSPYTKEYKRKFPLMPVILIVLIFSLLITTSIIVIKIVNKKPVMNSELRKKEVIWYEYTN